MDPHLARWLLLGGYACVAVLLLACGVLTAAERRRPSSGDRINTANRRVGDLAGWALVAALFGAVGILSGERGSPVPSSASYLLVLAAAVVVALGMALLAIFALRPSEVDHVQVGQPLPQLLAGFVAAAALVAGVTAALGLIGVVHVSPVELAAWAHVLAAGAVVAVGFLLLMIFLVASA
jgi:hypothetical protein